MCYLPFLAVLSLVEIPSFFLLNVRPPPIYTLFPYTTLFRSRSARPAPPSPRPSSRRPRSRQDGPPPRGRPRRNRDRKSTRLNSSHTVISYAVFCLKKKTERCGRKRGGAQCNVIRRATSMRSS